MASATLYSPDARPVTAAELRDLAPGAEVCELDGDPGWLRKAAIVWPGARVTVAVMEMGLVSEHLTRVMELVVSAAGHAMLRDFVREVRQVFRLSAEPGFTGVPAQLLRAISRHRRAVILRGGGIYGAGGRCLLEFPEARIARRHEVVDRAAVEAVGMPDPARCLRRARVLAAVAHRAHVDSAPYPNRGRLLDELRDWLRAACLDDELEPAERELIDAPPGAPWPGDLIAARGRLEGAGVIAWALGLLDLPGHDRAVDKHPLHRVLDVLSPPSQTAATLREATALARMAERLLLVHWRLRVMSARHIDFRRSARERLARPVDFGDVPLVDDDLAIDGVRISDAPVESVDRALAIAKERHRAINWLLGAAGVYSEVITAT